MTVKIYLTYCKIIKSGLETSNREIKSFESFLFAMSTVFALYMLLKPSTIIKGGFAINRLYILSILFVNCKAHKSLESVIINKSFFTSIFRSKLFLKKNKYLASFLDLLYTRKRLIIRCNKYKVVV